MNWVDLATVGSTALAAGGLFYAAQSFRLSAKTNDLQSLFQFFEGTRAAESRLHLADRDSDDWSRAFVDYLNHMEILAKAINSKLFLSETRDFSADRLCNDIAILMANPNTHRLISESVTAETTFSELCKFYARNKFLIDRRVVSFEEKQEHNA